MVIFLAYERLLSRNARGFTEKFMQVVPYKIRRVQTDNGKEFDRFLKKIGRLPPLQYFLNR